MPLTRAGRCAAASARHGWWAGPTAVGLAVRVAWALAAGQVDPFLQAGPLHGDAASYDLIVRSLLAGGGYGTTPGVASAFWPPLYPGFLASLYSAVGYHLAAARLAQALLGTATVAATALAAGDLYGRRAGLMAGLGMALYPHLVYFGAWLTAEALYLALLAPAVLLAVRLQRRPRLGGFAALGLLLGLAVLTKPYTAMLLPLLVVWALAAFPGRPLRWRAAAPGIVLLVSAAVVAPWTARNWRALGAFVVVSTNGGYTFYGANNAEAFGGHREGFPPPLPGLSEPEAEREYYQRGLAWIRSDPGGFVRLVGRKMARLLSPLSVASYERDYPLPGAGLVRAVYWGFLALALAGMLRSVGRWREVLILYALPLSVAANSALFYGDARYTLPMVPALVTFAASALGPGLERLRPHREGQSAAPWRQGRGPV